MIVPLRSAKRDAWLRAIRRALLTGRLWDARELLDDGFDAWCRLTERLNDSHDQQHDCAVAEAVESEQSDLGRPMATLARSDKNENVTEYQSVTPRSR